MTLDEFEQARARRKQASERVADLLKQAPLRYHMYGMDGLRARGERMEKCGSFYAGDVCPVCHTFHADVGSRCRDRLCPNCGWMQAVTRSLTTRRAINNLGDRFAIYHVVLTKRDPLAADGEKLHEDCKALVDAYTKMAHRDKLFRAKVWGSVRCLEISNNGQARYHPHIHALWLYKIPSTWTEGQFITHDELCTMWQNALGVDYRPVTWLEPIYYKIPIDETSDLVYNPSGEEGMEQASIDRAVCEACKYAIKPSLYEGADLQMLIELAQGVRGVHMFQLTGGMNAEYRKAEKELQEERRHTPGRCDTCGALADRVYLNWQDGGYVL